MMKKQTSPSKTDPDGLSIRERAFVHAILRGEKLGPAYQSAGYKVNNAHTAKSAGTRLAARPHVKAVIERERASLDQRNDIHCDELVSYLAQVVRTPIGTIDETSPLMQSYSRTDGEMASTVRFQMVSKMDAIKHLTYLLGFDPPKKTEVSVPNDLHHLLLTLRAGADQPTER